MFDVPPTLTSFLGAIGTQMVRLTLFRTFEASSLCAIVVSTAVTGCAGLNVSAVGDDAQANGIRYYEPANFLLVYSDAAGSVKSEIITLPDTTRKMVAKPHTVLAKNKQTLTFSDGVLASSSQEADATAIPSAVIAAVKTMATEAISKGLMNAPEAGPKKRLTLDAPKLYKITIHGDTIELVGTDHGDIIELPLAL